MKRRCCYCFNGLVQLFFSCKTVQVFFFKCWFFYHSIGVQASVRVLLRSVFTRHLFSHYVVDWFICTVLFSGVYVQLDELEAAVCENMSPFFKDATNVLFATHAFKCSLWFDSRQENHKSYERGMPFYFVNTLNKQLVSWIKRCFLKIFQTPRQQFLQNGNQSSSTL